jgi:tetratricopeptide (TPR) repeat protein
MACPDENEIVAFAGGGLQPDRMRLIETHIDTCPDCAALVSDAAAAVDDRSPSTDAPTILGADGAIAIAPALGPALARGAALGRYVLLDLLATGGLGQVYTAYDPELDRRVAIKLLRPVRGDTRPDAEAQRWLLREAQAMAKLSHPNVVPVHDVGMFGDHVFIAMELVDGQTLTEWLRERERGWREVRDLMLGAGLGLIAAHDAGLVHRDFKPGNVLVGREGRVRVVDFGLARAVAGPRDRASPVSLQASSPRLLEEELTKTGVIIGTPAYMAAEQFTGRDIDPRADQFAFCVTMYYGVYGVRPFEGRDIVALREAVLAGDVIPPPTGKSVPAWFRRAILRGLRPDPADRFPSMRALLEALTKDRRQRRVQWVGLLFSAAAGAAVATVALWPEPTQTDRANVETIVEQARAAAARAHFIYPPTEDPELPSAYERVLELEAMQGSASELADAAATDLRHEFADTLVRLGDAYWDREGGAPFAADYYGAAVMFDPDAPRAAERMLLTPGQLASLEHKARTGEFSSAELAAAETLVALADDDDDARREKVRALARTPASVRGQLLALVGEPEPEHAPAVAEIAEAEPTDAEPIDIDVEADVSRPVSSKPIARVHTPKAEPDADEIASAKRDPAAAEEEVRLGRAALGQGRAQQAEEHFHRALHHDPRSAGAVAGLCDVHFERGQFTHAVRHCERAVRLAPKVAGHRLILGDAYLKVMRYADAQKSYEAAKSLGHARAQSRLEMLAKKLGK